MMMKETILVFSQMTSRVLLVIFGGSIVFALLSLLAFKSTMEQNVIGTVSFVEYYYPQLLSLIPMSPIFSMMAVVSLLSFLFSKATIIMNDEGIIYSSGFLKKNMKFNQILSANVIRKTEVPSIKYKIWAYYRSGKINGLMKLRNGKTAYIVGNSASYLQLVSNKCEMIFAIGEKGLSQNMIDAILEMTDR